MSDRDAPAVRWGVIGCGDVVKRRVAQAILNDPDSELTALCRRDASRLADFGREFGVERRHTCWRELIEQGGLDAVYIATPVSLHREQTMAAANAGLHVLVEKPMAMRAAECAEMIAACEQADVRLGVAYYRRFYPVVERIRQLIESGEIGSVLHVDAITATPFLFRGDEDGAWRVDLERGGGGALMDIGSHRIDLFLHLCGEPAEIRGVCSTVAADHAAENCAVLAMTFSGGSTATARVFFGGGVDPDEFSVLGTAGRLISAPLNDGGLAIETAAGVRREQHPPHENFNSPLIADFVRAIRERRPPLIDGAAGAQTNSVMQACYENAGATWV